MTSKILNIKKFELGGVFFVSIFISAFIFLFLPFYNAQALTLTPIRMEIAGDPGQVLSQEMTLINERDTDEKYYASYANFEASGETGSPSFVNATEGLGTWMETVESIDLPANSSKIVQVKIKIPANADPGGHFAVVFWGTQPPTTDSCSLAIGAKVGMLVLLRVNGDVDENGGILEFATKDKQTFFTHLPVSFYYRFQNSGGDRIKPEGDIAMKNIFGMTAEKISANPVEGNILPNSIRKIEANWQGRGGTAGPTDLDNKNFLTKAKYEWRNFAFGRYKAKMLLTYGTQKETALSSFVFWVLPWHLLIFIIIDLFLVFIIVRFIFRRYKHWLISKIMHGDYGKIAVEQNTNEMQNSLNSQNNSQIQTETQNQNNTEAVKKPVRRRI